HRALRWTAVLALAEGGRLREARELQSRWSLRHIPTRRYWGSQFEWAQAAELSLLLGAPRLRDAYDTLLPFEGQLIDVGTGLAVWGTVDDLLGRLAERLGEDEAAERHVARSAAVAARVADALGVVPGFGSRPSTVRTHTTVPE
ncbi:hypothetical protein, partial [Microbacterium sp.]|uniref:hypothetical protein n=1 Tax=Microbacterium sp. TaxID=51671 RepID=UPI003C74C98E